MKKTFIILLLTLFSNFLYCNEKVIYQSNNIKSISNIKLTIFKVNIPLIKKYNNNSINRSSYSQKKSKSKDYEFFTFSAIMDLIVVGFLILGTVFLLPGIPILAIGLYNYNLNQQANNFNIGFLSAGSSCLGMSTLFYLPIIIYEFANIGLNIYERTGERKIFTAVYLNDLKKLEKLLLKEDIEQTNISGETLLIYSVRYYHYSSMKLLIEKGANINSVDRDGKSALYYAIKNKKNVEYLINHGADVNIKDNENRTALIYAVSNSDFIKLLVDHGADINVKDNDGRTALHEAFYINYDSAKYLIMNGADVNIKDNEGLTPIMIFIKSRNPFIHAKEIIPLFIDNNVEINIKDKLGKTALDYAIEIHESNSLYEYMNNDTIIIDMLKELGAKKGNEL